MGSIDDLRFTPGLLTRPAPRGMAVETTLLHFAIVTFTVDPEQLRSHLHPRFEPDRIIDADGVSRALVSAVTFLDRDFRFVALPWLRGRFGQTNYRAYVTDRQTGEHVVWFFGTCLDSWSVLVPRHAWQLPWHRARMRFDCEHDQARQAYSRFRVDTASDWAPAQLELEDTGRPPAALAGFTNLESGLVLLTHPLRGYFRRRDGRLGSYAIWHPRLEPRAGRVTVANYPLLQTLGLVAEGDTPRVHSVLLQGSIDFTIYLPPARVGHD